MNNCHELSKKVLQETKKPMTSAEIWNYIVEKGYQTNLKGKTPWNTISAQLYTDISSNQNSPFVKLGPALFGLKEIDYSVTKENTTSKTSSQTSSYVERDLHPLLVSFVNSNEHFYGHTKTIYHENSRKSTKNSEKWVHPDLVSVHFPFNELKENTITLAKNTVIDTIEIFSFEMKKEITSTNVRESFFQTVSNSSWANEGYLVAPKFDEESLIQLRKLSNSFGIGVIRLDLSDVHQSEIIFPSDIRDLDLSMVDHLSRINSDFSSFIDNINESLTVKHMIENNFFDKVLSDNEMEKYIQDKNMIKSRNISSM